MGEPIQSVQTFGRKKTATAVAYCKRGKGLIKFNGRPLELVEPRALQFKLMEPVLLLGKDRFADIDIRIRVKGGGQVSGLLLPEVRRRAEQAGDQGHPRPVRPFPAGG